MKCSLVPLLAVLSFSPLFLAAPVQAQDAPPPGVDPNAPPPPEDDQGSGDDQSASYQTFYDQLGNDGQWIQTDNYGYVFQPNVDQSNWAPYTDGHWVYTDEGWMWVSDEPWGWATYHYGRWALLDGIGWVWVPGYQWAPAWVSWRYGDGYCGWAPLPPEANYGGYGSYHFGADVDASFHIGADRYHFVRADQMGDPNVRTAFVSRSRNASLFRGTTNVTNINVGRNFGQHGNAAFSGVSVGGPPIAAINAHASHRVPTVQLTAASSPGISRVHGNSVAVFAPHVNAATATTAHPAAVSRNIGRANLSQGTAANSGAVTHHHQISPTAASSFTGEGTSANAAPQQQQFHSAAAQPQVHHQTAATGSAYAPTGSASPPVHHEAAQAQSFHATESAAPVQHHESAPAQVFHTSQSAPPVEHHESAPQQAFHESAPPQHFEQHQSAPPQVHAAAPPPIQHAAAPAPHPAPAPAPAPAAAAAPPQQKQH